MQDQRMFAKKVLVAVLAVGVCAFTAACGTSTPTAPSGSTVRVIASPTSVSFNGTATIAVDLVTPSGGVPEDGTIVTFSATLGSVEPSQAPTANGRATATFLAGSASGSAVITASLGSVGTSSGSVTISIGTQAATRVLVTAEPPVVPFSGGTSVVTAVVVDASGNPLISIPITFATTAGSVAPTPVKTDASGKAQTTLTTSQPAIVTAGVGADGSASKAAGAGPTGSVPVTIAPRPQPTVTVTPGQNPTAQTPVSFTITAAPAAGSGTTIQTVSIDFGDSTPVVNLGPASGTGLVAQHRYRAAGTFRVTVTAVDSAGGTGTAVAVIVVAAQAPLSVAVAYAPPVPSAAITIYTFTAAVMPATVVVASYQWNFGDGSPAQTTTSPQLTHSFKNGAGPYTVSVTVLSIDGLSTEGFTIINP
jgi:hypothetical protein